MHHMKTTPTPPPKPIRLTISVSPEVHQTFTNISKTLGVPVGRAMGDWLGDTLDAANYLSDTLVKARQAPRLVAQQLHAYAHGLTDEAGELLERVRKDPATRAPLRPAPRGGSGSAAPFTPPSCNTGGKVPQRKGKPS